MPITATIPSIHYCGTVRGSSRQDLINEALKRSATFFGPYDFTISELTVRELLTYGGEVLSLEADYTAISEGNSEQQ